MMYKRKSLQNYLMWFLKEYRAIKSETNNNDIYRIIRILDKKGQCIIESQVIGKNIKFKESLNKIMNNRDLLYRFSKHDIKTISFYAYQETIQPTYKIASQEFNKKNEQLVFTIKNIQNNQLLRMTASEISSNKDLIDKLTRKDAHIIGYVTGCEQTIKESSIIGKKDLKTIAKN